MKNFISIVGLIFISCGCSVQKMPYDLNTKLELKILDKHLSIMPGDQWLSINISITNKSNQSFLLYDFKVIQPGSTPIEDSMQPDWVASNEVFAFKDSVGSIFIVQPLPGLGLPESLDTLIYVDNLMELQSKNMVKEKLVLKRGETWSGELKAHLNKKRFLDQSYYEEIEGIKIEGDYELFLIYNCGVNITNLIDESKIRTDEKRNRAVLFQGYVRSNTVTLTVEGQK